MSYRSALQGELKRHTNYLEYQHCSELVCKLMDEHKAKLKTDIKNLDKKIKELINGADNLRKTFEIITSVLGIGAQAAALLLCELPELGHINRKKTGAGIA